LLIVLLLLGNAFLARELVTVGSKVHQHMRALRTQNFK
jgi:hypothetical protein